jgi:putative oxidoreductase
MSHVSSRSVLAPAREPGRALNVVLWLLQVGAAAMFLTAGSMKLSGAPPMVALFDAIGIGQWFRYLTGGLEVLGAVALLVPRASDAGALLLAAVMVGAVATHLFVVGGSPLAAAVLLVTTSFIAWSRRARTLELLGLGRRAVSSE